MNLSNPKTFKFVTGVFCLSFFFNLFPKTGNAQFFSGATKTSTTSPPSKSNSPKGISSYENIGKVSGSEDPDSGLTIQTLVPEKGQFDIRPSLLFSYRDWAGTDASSTFSNNGYPTIFKLNLFYGLTDYNALELGLSYANYEMNEYNTSRLIASGAKTVTKNAGMDALYIGYRGFYDMTYLFIHWGLGYAYGVQPLKMDAHTGSASVTPYMGQDMVIPNITLVMPLESFIAGVGFEYRWAQDGSGTVLNNDGSESRFNIFGGGGQAITLFTELPKLEHLNAELKYDRILGASMAVPNSSATPLFKPKELVRASGSMRFEFGKHFELIPLIFYQTYLNKNEIRIGYSKMDEYGSELKIRAVF